VGPSFDVTPCIYVLVKLHTALAPVFEYPAVEVPRPPPTHTSRTEELIADAGTIVEKNFIFEETSKSGNCASIRISLYPATLLNVFFVVPVDEAISVHASAPFFICALLIALSSYPFHAAIQFVSAQLIPAPL